MKARAYNLAVTLGTLIMMLETLGAGRKWR
jgi:hypothetical protein